MLVRDLMKAGVCSVSPDVPVGAIVDLLSDRGIGAVPVLEASGALLGIVTEADLLRRLVLADEVPTGWLRSWFEDYDRAAERYARAHGATARDVMTRPVWAVAEDSTAEHAARLLEEHGIQRLPVLRDGRVVGMISRTDLLRALLPAGPAEQPTDTSDQAIRDAISARMRQQVWAEAPLLSVDVRGGIVELGGYHRSDAVRRALCALIASVPGVRRVVDNARELPPGSMSA
ncbi:CBS domain-containing protein [Falsiroseomonas oryziterrae]|uniref:CBS domain-containing protein n=1 Tax=Falsiroseomonas oryziterrae TaxID=2911368 RepID=UPI001F341DAB|nr:CBS domain-containing protein [Roseomonas sp. NPKOSM-4]